MMSREVTEGLQQQGADEAIQYTLTVAPTPTDVTDVAVYDVTGIPVDVTATVMPTGDAAVAGAVITLPLLTGLTADHLYRVAVRYTDGTNVVEPFFRVLCR